MTTHLKPGDEIIVVMASESQEQDCLIDASVRLAFSRQGVMVRATIFSSNAQPAILAVFRKEGLVT